MQNIKEQLANTVQEVEDGNISALEVYAELKTLEKFVKDCYSQIEGSAMNEADNYSEKTISLDKFEITKRNGSVTYDYSKNSEVKDLEGKLKGIKEILKQASKLGKSIIDEETGETFEPCPIKYASKDSLAIKVQ